jgi:hypothetical protein
VLLTWCFSSKFIATKITEEPKQVEAEEKTMSDILSQIELYFGKVNEVAGHRPTNLCL